MSRRYLIELFLPLFDNDGKRLPAHLYEAVKAELVERFGGMTAHLRAPATGMWKKTKHGPPERDLIVIYEVMIPRLERKWWANYRRELETKFRQSELVVRAHRIRSL